MRKAIQQVAPVALAIVTVAMVIGTGAILLGQFGEVSYAETDVAAETATPSTPLPTNYTLDGSTNADYVQISDGSVEVVLEDSSASSNTTLTEGTDYEVFYTDGKVELQSSPGGISYDDTSDTIYTDYSYESEGTASSVVDSGENALGTFGDFLVPLAVVAVAAVIFLLLGGMQLAGNRTMK